MPATVADAAVRREGDAAVIELRGDLNAAANAVIDRAYEDATSQDATKIVLNFADVTYINSTGIALIVGLLARARTEKRTVTACGLSEHYRHIFEITRLADFMPMFDSEATALATAG